MAPRLLALALVLQLLSAATAHKKRPNFLILFLDDHTGAIWARTVSRYVKTTAPMCAVRLCGRLSHRKVAPSHILPRVPDLSCGPSERKKNVLSQLV